MHFVLTCLNLNFHGTLLSFLFFLGVGRGGGGGVGGREYDTQMKYAKTDRLYHSFIQTFMDNIRMSDGMNSPCNEGKGYVFLHDVDKLSDHFNKVYLVSINHLECSVLIIQCTYNGC